MQSQPDSATGATTHIRVRYLDLPFGRLVLFVFKVQMAVALVSALWLTPVVALVFFVWIVDVPQAVPLLGQF